MRSDTFLKTHAKPVMLIAISEPRWCGTGGNPSGYAQDIQTSGRWKFPDLRVNRIKRNLDPHEFMAKGKVVCENSG